MSEGIIIKALSGFYYVSDGEKVVSCRAKGRFRHVSTSPLVGDHVSFVPVTDSTGVIEAIAPRRNSFIRPAVANIDCLVFVLDVFVYGYLLSVFVIQSFECDQFLACILVRV